MKKVILYLMIFFLATFISDQMLSAQQNTRTRARLDIEYLDLGVNKRQIKIKLTSKINKKYQPISGADVDIFISQLSDSTQLGTVNTNKEGLAYFDLRPGIFNPQDTLIDYLFIASLKDHPALLDRKKELTIRNFELKTEIIDEDSMKWFRVMAMEKSGPGSYIPIEELEILFFVDRPFRMLPISDPLLTDAEGKATILFPDDLPGDEKGYVTAIAKVDDSDIYGTIEKRETLQWGIPTQFQDKSLKRSLWAAGANAPIVLLLMTNGLIAITWGIIFYIVFKLYKLRQL